VRKNLLTFYISGGKMKKILFVLTFALVAALALSACEPADDSALTDVERTATAEAAFGVEPAPGLEDPDLAPAPGDPVLTAEPVDPPPATDVEMTPTADTAVQPGTDTTVDSVDVDDDERAEIYRLSEIIDWNVRDQAGEEVGEVHSFVVDQQTGFIHYVLISPDGELEVDGDYVAVPWNALAVSHLDMALVDTTDQVATPETEETPVDTDVVVLDDDPHFVLNVDREVLANSPVIDDIDDIDFASPMWQDEYAVYWDGQLAGLPATGDVETAGELQSGLHLDEVTGYDIYNTEDDQIADVAEMIVNPETGKITHIVAGFGGFLGLGERYVAIPFTSFDYDQEEEHFVLQATEEELETAPGYESLDEFSFDQPNWADEYDRFWGTGLDTQEGEQVATPTP
jgi:sporulation protein YlmC with PRC-barrel domain